MLKNKISYFVILLSFGLIANNFAFPIGNAFAQDYEEEEELDEEEYEEEESAPAVTTEPSSQSSSTPTAKKEESLLDKLENADLNKLDLFQIVSDMERKNMLIKLQMEQEKLHLALQKLKQEKETMDAKTKEAQLKRDIEKRKLDGQVADEELTRKKAKGEIEKTQMVERRKQNLISKVAEAFALNPKQDYTGLLNMIKSENNGIVPEELRFIEDKMKAMQTEERDKLTKQAANSIMIDQKVALEKALEIYSIIGIKGELIATVRNKLNAQTFKVKEGTQISNGFVVSGISPEFVTFTKGSEVKTLYLNVNTSSN